VRHSAWFLAPVIGIVAGLSSTRGDTVEPRQRCQRQCDRNRSTILREAQEAMVSRGLLGHEQEFLDSLHVMEEGMRHFSVLDIAI
jgi:hypothetical protein